MTIGYLCNQKKIYHDLKKNPPVFPRQYQNTVSRADKILPVYLTRSAILILCSSSLFPLPPPKYVLFSSDMGGTQQGSLNLILTLLYSTEF
jgi:hypothetical protein